MMDDTSATPRYAAFASITEALGPKQLELCASLFDELAAIGVSLACLKDRADEIKLELDRFQASLGSTGLRSSQYAYTHQYVPGRMALDKTLLMENGVHKSIIDCSMRAGKPYERREFRKLPKEGESGGLEKTP